VDDREILSEYRNWPLARATQQKLPIFEPGHSLVEGSDFPKKGGGADHCRPRGNAATDLERFVSARLRGMPSLAIRIAHGFDREGRAADGPSCCHEGKLPL